MHHQVVPDIDISTLADLAPEIWSVMETMTIKSVRVVVDEEKGRSQSMSNYTLHCM